MHGSRNFLERDFLEIVALDDYSLLRREGIDEIDNTLTELPQFDAPIKGQCLSFFTAVEHAGAIQDPGERKRQPRLGNVFQHLVSGVNADLASAGNWLDRSLLDGNASLALQTLARRDLLLLLRELFDAIQNGPVHPPGGECPELNANARIEAA
jgi:hypothetical protein